MLSPIRKLLQAATSDQSTTANSSISLDSSMTLAILIVFTAFAFMGFFSVYSRCFSNNSPSPSSTTATAHRNHPDPSMGLDPSTVKSLLLLPYDTVATPRLLEDCPICLSEFRDTESGKMIPYCGHVFHPGCIDTWLKSQVSCPLCRSTRLLTVAAEEV